jgi:hypothetical protein
MRAQEAPAEPPGNRVFGTKNNKQCYHPTRAANKSNPANDFDFQGSIAQSKTSKQARAAYRSITGRGGGTDLHPTPAADADLAALSPTPAHGSSAAREPGEERRRAARTEGWRGRARCGACVRPSRADDAARGDARERGRGREGKERTGRGGRRWGGGGDW